MVHYLTDERLKKKIALGHQKGAQMTALEVKSVYLALCRGSQVLLMLGSQIIFPASLTVTLPFSYCCLLLVYLIANITFCLLFIFSFLVISVLS